MFSQEVIELNDLSTFIISLDPIPRNGRLLEQLHGQKISSQLVSAIDGRSWSYPFDSSLVNVDRFKTLTGRMPSGGEIGCALSHLKCAKLAQALEANYALVLEDDAELEEDLASALELVGRLDTGQPLIVCLFVHQNSVVRKKSLQVVEGSASRVIGRFFTPPSSAVAYLMNRAAIDIFASKTVIEGVSDWPPFAYSFEFWGIFPSPVRTTRDGSTIESGRKLISGEFKRRGKLSTFISTYLGFFRIGRIREHSKSLGSYRAYLKFVIIPHTLYFARTFNSARHKIGQHVYEAR